VLLDCCVTVPTTSPTLVIAVAASACVSPTTLGTTTCTGLVELKLAVTNSFAVGDVRSGSVKRVASAVGEGSVVVQAIHAHLASLRQSEAREPVTL
jgi:hypothetical protein